MSARKRRVIAFIDGFNLYHAISELSEDYLKWVDLSALCATFAPSSDFDLVAVRYFTAFATWNRSRCDRHRAYVDALRATGVTVVLSSFKEKQRSCLKCNATWVGHEEKETDVKIAVDLLSLAVRDRYDRALIISQDSDLAPGIRAASQHCPAKDFQLITPVGRPHSSALRKASNRPPKEIIRLHLERALLPETVVDDSGNVAAVRPTAYAPPAKAR